MTNSGHLDEAYFGSDIVADFLSSVGIDYVALNAGATLRGLHDSLLRRESPSIVSTLHEEIAVGVAHGYAKASGRLMAAAIHDHVGPLHAHMALFNAWADDVPIVVLGGSGPRDVALRRPWLDWIHTASPTSSPIRDSVKWDTEPASVEAILPSLRRAYREAVSFPRGPVFVALDAALQETSTHRPEMPPIQNVPPPVLREADVDDLVTELAESEWPVFVIDRPPPGAMVPLVRIAERLGAAVIDLGSRCSFPTTHWADQTQHRERTLAEADLVVLLDPRDPVWAVTSVDETSRSLSSLIAAPTRVVSIGLAATSSKPVDRSAELDRARHLAAHVPSALEQIDQAIAGTRIDHEVTMRRTEQLRERWSESRLGAMTTAHAFADQSPIHPAHLSLSLKDAVADGPWQISNGLLGGWLRSLWDWSTESAYLGRSGGEGLGYGLPASVGAALAHRDDDTLVVDLQSDGDMLYTSQALWTASHHRLPLLVVVYDNKAYGRDLIHQRLVARQRGWEGSPHPEGVVIRDPDVGFTQLAEGFGVEGVGPVVDTEELPRVLVDAAHSVRTERRPVLVHVIAS